MLTEKQAKVFIELEKYMEANKIAPTVRELAELTGLKSTSTVQGYLNRLEKKGYIKKHPTYPRSITILKDTVPKITVPLHELRKIKEQLELLGIKDFGILGGIKFE